jgi:amino acid adenylation domain-containing protein
MSKGTSPSVDRAAETAPRDPADALDFWRGQLSGAPDGVPLPRRGLVDGTAGRGSQRVVLADGVASGLVALGESAGGTATTALLSGIETLLARYGAADDLLLWIGLSAVAEAGARPAPATGATALPARVGYDGDLSVQAVLAGVRERAQTAYEHRAVDLGQLARTGFAGQTRVAVTLAGRQAASGPVAEADLTLSFAPGQPGEITADYQAARVTDDTIARLLSSLAELLAGMAGNPGRRVGDLPLIADEERAVILGQWSGPSVPRQDTVPAHELLARQAIAAPGAIAMIHGERQVSYRELDERANQLAHHLRGLGVAPGGRVAVCTTRSPEMVIGMLAVLKTGAAYLPIDPGYPVKRVSFLLADAVPGALLTDSRTRGRLPDSTAVAVELDTGWPEISAQPVTPPDVRTRPDDLAYIIYTSGSTGQPKGVEIPHSGLNNLIRWHQDTYRLTDADRTTQLAGTSFDASVWEIWPTLTAGGTLHLADPSPSVPDLMRWLAERKITVAFLPTPLAELMLDEPWPAGCALRYLLTGGDTLHRPPPAGLPFTLVNHYGPTENTVVTTAGEVPSEAGAGRREPSIGRPIANTRVYLLDSRMQPVPVGVPGELYVGGAGLARGYLNRPELTRQRFVSDPFSEDPGARLYRTGDVVSWRPDGSIDFRGRADSQVKVNGVRIELGEIEAAATTHPDVAEAAVLVREDTPGHRRLVAYVVGRAAGRPGVAELREWLSAALPAFMVPAAFVEMDALPLTQHGKVDRRRLPAPGAGRARGLGDFTAPRDGTEAELAALWEELLGIVPIGALDDFFALGGNSLAATRIVIRLREAYGLDLPLSCVLAEPTIRALAGEVERRGREPVGLASKPILPVARTGRHPLTHAQREIWLLDQLAGDGITYNIPLRLELRGELRPEALRQALRSIVARHEPLRTTFPMVGGDPVQAVADPPELDLPVVEARDIGDEREWVIAESRRRFEVTEGPLLRCLLLRRTPDDHLLLVVVHHIVFDGWSLGVFCRELAEHYRATVTGTTPDLPELTVQSVDLAAWQQDHLTADTLAADVAYWRETLADAPPTLELPTDLARPARATGAGARAILTLDSDLTDRVTRFSHAEGVTVFMTLLAAFTVLLSRYCGSDDIVIGSPVAARLRPELEPLVGCFINTLPLRTDLSGDPGFRELAARVRAVTLAAYEHQGLASGRILDAVRPDRPAGQSPFFNLIFAFEDAHDPHFELAGVRAEVTEIDFRNARAELGFSITPMAGGLRVCAEYRDEIFTEGTIRRLLEHFSVLLGAALDDPVCPVTALPILSPAQRRQMLVEWNDTSAEFPTHSCLHQLVENQAALTPDATAVVFEDEARLTYRELDERANQLARHLRSLGVSGGDTVGVCLHRSPQMIGAVLAVLKAGGAYVPLDPANPADRLAFMAADAGLAAILTERDLSDRLPSGQAAVVEVDTEWEQITTQPVSRPENAVGPGDPAYVIYTSGSTGQPKGVLIEHRAIANFIHGIQGIFGLGSHDSVLQFASLGFDVSVFEIFGALACGARLCLARQETLLSVTGLTQFMRRHSVSVTDIPPAVMNLLDATAFPALRIAFVGCEAYSGDLVDRWAPGRRFFNGYGPTEATVTMTTQECAPGNGRQSPAIGRPMPNVTTYVLDRNGQPMPIGVPGELHIGGVGLARGYLNNQDLTARKFIPDPFSDDPAARLYRTGDMVRYLPDGRLEFIGRIDRQLKLRGLRIEPGEIEIALRTHPDVDDAAVVLRESAGGQRRLVGYVTRRDGAAAHPAALRAHLAESLPPHMVPSAFVALDAFPVNLSGKVDRNALPEPDPQELAATAGFVAPRNRRERVLAGIWASLLEIPELGVHDNFFALGGHSLLGVRLVWEVRETFGVEITIRNVFEKPTVASLTVVIEDAMLDLLDSGQLPDPLSNGSVPAEVTPSITHPKGEAR